MPATITTKPPPSHTVSGTERCRRFGVAVATGTEPSRLMVVMACLLWMSSERRSGRLRSSRPDPRVEGGVGRVDEDVHQHEGQRREEDARLDDRIVPLGYGVE